MIKIRIMFANMSACVWFFLCAITTATAFKHYSVISTPETKNRTVGQEAVLDISNKNKLPDVKFLDNVQTLISKVKTVIDRHNVLRRNLNSGNLDNFIGFIKNLIDILIKLKDSDLEYFFTVFNDEIKKYHYRGCKFHELIDNLDFRRFIAIELDRLKIMPASILRNKMLSLSNYIEEGKFNKNDKELIDFVNSMYKDEAAIQFEKFLIKVDDYRLKAGKGVNLVDIIRKGLRSIVFDHYTQLNKSARVALKTKIDEYWDSFSTISNLVISQAELQEIMSQNHLAQSPAKILNRSEKEKIRSVYVHKNRLQNSHRTKKNTKEIKTHKTLEEENLDSSEDSYSSENSDTETTTKVSKTFMTLYPHFISDRKTLHVRSNVPAKKQSSSSTPKHEVSSFWKSRDRDIETNRKPRKRVYDSDSEQSTSIRIQDTTRRFEELNTFKQMYVEKDRDLNYDPYAAYSTAQDRDKKVRKHRKEDTTARKRRVTKRRKKINYSHIPRAYTTRNKYNKLKNSDVNKQPNSGEPSTLRKAVKYRAKLEFVTVRSYVPRKRMRTKKIKNQVIAKTTETYPGEPALYLKKPEFLYNMAGSLFPRRGLPVIRQYEQLPMELPSPSIPTDIEEPQGIVLSDTLKYITSAEGRPLLYEKGIDKGIRARGPSIRRFNNAPKDGIVVGKNFMTRIQQLEKELNVVRNQIKNDSEIIKVLSSKVHVTDMHNSRKEFKNPNIIYPYVSTVKTETNKDKEAVTYSAQIKQNIRKQNDPPGSPNNNTNGILMEAGAGNLYYSKPNDNNQNVERKNVFNTSDSTTNNVKNNNWGKLKKQLKNYDFKKLREEQERKYYSNSSAYAVPKARIYDSDSDKYKNRDNLEKNTVIKEDIYNFIDNIQKEDVVNNKTNIGTNEDSNKNTNVNNIEKPAHLNSKGNMYQGKQDIYLRHNSPTSEKYVESKEDERQDYSLNKQSNEEKLYTVNTSTLDNVKDEDINKKANAKLYEIQNELHDLNGFDDEMLEEDFDQGEEYPDSVADAKNAEYSEGYSNASTDIAQQNIDFNNENITDENLKKDDKESNRFDKVTLVKDGVNTNTKEDQVEYYSNRGAVQNKLDTTINLKESEVKHDSYEDLVNIKSNKENSNNTISYTSEKNYILESGGEKGTVPNKIEQTHNLVTNKDENKGEMTQVITSITASPDGYQIKGNSYEIQLQKDHNKIELINELIKHNSTPAEDAVVQKELTKEKFLDNKYESDIRMRKDNGFIFKTEYTNQASITTANTDLTTRVSANKTIITTASSSTNPTSTLPLTSPSLKNDLEHVTLSSPSIDDKTPEKLNENEDFQSIINKTLALQAERRYAMDESGLLGHFNL